MGQLNVSRVLRVHRIKTREIVWILEGIVSPASLCWCRSKAQLAHSVEGHSEGQSVEQLLAGVQDYCYS